jgi:hypothetical protein
VGWREHSPDLVRAEGRNAAVLASDGERDDAVRVLNEAFAEGRLTGDEHGERVRAAYAARTWRDLDRVTTDLPGPPDALGQVAQGEPGDLDRCVLCALICWPPTGIAWLLTARHRARAARRNSLAATPPSTAGGTAAQLGAGPHAENR